MLTQLQILNEDIHTAADCWQHMAEATLRMQNEIGNCYTRAFKNGRERNPGHA